MRAVLVRRVPSRAAWPAGGCSRAGLGHAEAALVDRGRRLDLELAFDQPDRGVEGDRDARAGCEQRAGDVHTPRLRREDARRPEPHQRKLGDAEEVVRLQVPVARGVAGVDARGVDVSSIWGPSGPTVYEPSKRSNRPRTGGGPRSALPRTRPSFDSDRPSSAPSSSAGSRVRYCSLCLLGLVGSLGAWPWPLPSECRAPDLRCQPRNHADGRAYDGVVRETGSSADSDAWTAAITAVTGTARNAPAIPKSEAPAVTASSTTAGCRWTLFRQVGQARSASPPSARSSRTSWAASSRVVYRPAHTRPRTRARLPSSTCRPRFMRCTSRPSPSRFIRSS